MASRHRITIGAAAALVTIMSLQLASCGHSHTFSKEWTSDDTHHWHAATCVHEDERRDEAEHAFGEWAVTKAATCGEAGARSRECSVCGYEGTEALGATGEHTFGEWVVTKAATCSQKGERKRECSVCGREETEEIAIDGDAHSYSDGWTWDAVSHWHAATCAHASEIKNKAEHAFGENGKCKECLFDPMGEPLSGKFSVSAGKQVRFSRGALYHEGADPGKGWALEASQLDFRTWPVKGSSSAVIGGASADTPAGSTGLFYWSKDKAKTYAQDYSDPEKAVTDAFAFAGGGVFTGLDVLTYDEWGYLLNTRTDASSKWGLATITGITGSAGLQGLILLPDLWDLPEDLTFTSGKGGGYSTNSYTLENWAKMEQADAVFLPATGGRDGASLYEFGSFGYWWSASPGSSSATANHLDFRSSSIYVYNDSSRNFGRAVRLVKIAE